MGVFKVFILGVIILVSSSILCVSTVLAAGPAGVDEDLELWLSADSGALDLGGENAGDNEQVEIWEDQSTVGRNAARDGGGAIFSLQGLNFNPTLNFSDDRYIADSADLADGSDDRSIFVVASANSGGWRYVLGAGSFGGGAPEGSGFDFGHSDVNQRVFITTHNPQYAETGSWLPYGSARLAYGAVDATRLYIAVNGETPIMGTDAAVNTILGETIKIGSNSRSDEYWNGNISEVIYYNRVVTAIERQRINSYLALKYGFSLDQSTPQSYLASGSNLMWDKDALDASTYDNGLFGIGRDDASNLAQIKSRGQTTTNVIILEAVDEGTNGNGDFTDMDNLEFLVIGDNSGSASWTTTGAPTGYSVLERRWKKQEQGDLGEVRMDFDVADPDFNIPVPLDNDDYYFIYDTDNDGSLSDETPLAMIDQGSNLWRVTVNFGTGGLFTLASTENPAITSFDPEDNAVDVPINTNLEITFSQSVVVGDGNIEIRRTSDDSLIESIEASSGQVVGVGTNTITINPSSNLINGTGYYVLIDDDAFEDGDDNFFGGIASTDAWNFTTVSAPSPTPTPTSSSNFSPSSSSSSPLPRGCSDQVPSQAPDLFQVSTSPNTATLYFVPVNPATGYIISYGTSASADQYSTSFDYANSNGAVSYTINSLSSGAPYYFKVQAKNGCATGPWSQVLSQITTGNFQPTSGLNMTSSSTPPSRGEIVVVDKQQSDSPKQTSVEANKEEAGDGYEVEIVVKKNGKPVEGATVELHSIPRRTTTDKEGIARFSNVEGGEHTVYMAYEGYRGSEKIKLNSENKSVIVNLSIELRTYNDFVIGGAVIVFIILIGTIGFLLFILKRRKKEDKERAKI